MSFLSLLVGIKETISSSPINGTDSDISLYLFIIVNADEQSVTLLAFAFSGVSIRNFAGAIFVLRCLNTMSRTLSS